MLSPDKVNKVRRKINNLGLAISKQGGAVIAHPLTCFGIPAFFWGYGVHFSSQGNDIFLCDLQLGKELLTYFFTGWWATSSRVPPHVAGSVWRVGSLLCFGI